MSKNEVKVRFNNQIVNAYNVTPDTIQRKSIKIVIENEAEIVITPMIVSILRLDSYNDVGEPIYYVTAHNVVTAENINPALLKKEEKNE